MFYHQPSLAYCAWSPIRNTAALDAGQFFNTFKNNKVHLIRQQIRYVKKEAIYTMHLLSSLMLKLDGCTSN